MYLYYNNTLLNTLVYKTVSPKNLEKCQAKEYFSTYSKILSVDIIHYCILFLSLPLMQYMYMK